MKHVDPNTISRQDPPRGPNLLDSVMWALKVTRRIPVDRPVLDLPAAFHRDNIDEFYLEQHPNGWVANVSFRHVPPGQGNTYGTADSLPLPKEIAFLAGVAIVCEIVTGSRDLPFEVVGDRLVCVAYGE